MIVQWKAIGIDTFRTEWCDMVLVLERGATMWSLVVLSKQPGEVLEVNGKESALVRQEWATNRQAFAAIDACMCRVISKLTAMAHQRTPRRLVNYAN